MNLTTISQSIIDKTAINRELKFCRAAGKVGLRKDMLSAFKQWLNANGHPTKDPITFGHEVLQVQVGAHWMNVWKRADLKHVYTIDGRMKPLLQAFLSAADGERM